MTSSERPAKRAKLLSDSESSEDESELNQASHGGLTINEDFARRFEHNKKREEKDRLEEKYGKASAKSDRGQNGLLEDDEDSSEDESEDDDAELATKDLDAEIEETLAAIRRKDPRVYDKEITFYREFDADAKEVNGVKKEKSMSLHDYHRKNLMEGYTGDDDDEVTLGAHRTYDEDQEGVRRDLVAEINAKATNGEASDADDDEWVGRKVQPTRNELRAQLPTKEITDADVAAADKDPQMFLSNFMAARAWLPTAASKWTAFDSDDSEDEERAEEFEEAYNLRFEDPEHANEKLMTFSRDAAKYSVRRDDVKGGARKRAREREKEKKDLDKKERQEERKRLRDLRVEDAAEKIKKIREAAGMRGKDINIDDWRDVLDGDFDDDKWEQEMRNRFGENYYAAADEENLSEPEIKQENGAGKKHKLLKKPTWNDDIDINDLVPDFEQEEASKPAFTLTSDEESDDEEEDGGVPLGANDSGEEESAPPAKKRKSKKDFAKEKADARRAARIERRKIEEMVDSNLPLNHPSLAATNSNQPVAGFRYRETSPTSFGLTARDILFADDSQLNQYAGLKKMAAFRDSERKRKDKKRYSKKGRLREWRKEVFGSKDEPSGGFEKVLGGEVGDLQDDAKVKLEGAGEGAKSKKRKRSKKQKQGTIVA